MSIGGTIVTSAIVSDVAGNLSSPCPISMISSTRFRLAELTAFVGGSEFFLFFQFFLTTLCYPNSSSCLSSCQSPSSIALLHFRKSFCLKTRILSLFPPDWLAFVPFFHKIQFSVSFWCFSRILCSTII